MTNTNPPESTALGRAAQWSKHLLTQAHQVEETAREWGARAAKATRAGAVDAKGRTEAWRLRRERRACCERIGAALFVHRDAPGIGASVVAAPEMSPDLERIEEIDRRLGELRETATGDPA